MLVTLAGRIRAPATIVPQKGKASIAGILTTITNAVGRTFTVLAIPARLAGSIRMQAPTVLHREMPPNVGIVTTGSNAA